MQNTIQGINKKIVQTGYKIVSEIPENAGQVKVLQKPYKYGTNRGQNFACVAHAKNRSYYTFDYSGFCWIRYQFPNRITLELLDFLRDNKDARLTLQTPQI